MKKVLVIGMLDSVHLARWLSQFEDSQIRFTIFPSKKFKYVHPDLVRLVQSNKNFNLIQSKFIKIFGIKELFFDTVLAKFCDKFKKEIRLFRLIEKNQFQLIHLIEIQGAGYLLLSMHQMFKMNLPKILLTNWGSDIYYFQNQERHLDKIKKVLKIADFYSAECYRDYDLARDLNFTGFMLPCVPNAGGINEDYIKLNILESRDRNTIIVKGYEGEFGRASEIIPALESALSSYPSLNVFIYSLSSILLERIQILESKFPNRLNYVTEKKPIERRELMSIFLKSKVYIGASVSDGLSTSFLEAISLGAFPIQTNTSCANEIIRQGAKGCLVSVNSNEITKSLLQILSDDDKLDRYRKINKDFALKNLSYSRIRQESQLFYEI